MYRSAFQAYQQTGVLAAGPVELVRMLYRGAIDHTERARLHLAHGDIAARSASITKAMEIVTELITSLSGEDGLAGQLRELYGYVLHRLADANARQADEPLVEAIQLLTTLLDAWRQVDGAQESGAEGLEPVAANY